MRKNFIYKNEEFKCEHCGAKNPLSEHEIRNHCRICLYSKHLDLNVPGDRESECLGLMEPATVFYNPAKGYQISFVCLECGKSTVNKTLSDDNFDLICKLTTNGRDVA